MDLRSLENIFFFVLWLLAAPRTEGILINTFPSFDLFQLTQTVVLWSGKNLHLPLSTSYLQGKAICLSVVSRCNFIAIYQRKFRGKTKKIRTWFMPSRWRCRCPISRWGIFGACRKDDDVSRLLLCEVHGDFSRTGSLNRTYRIDITTLFILLRLLKTFWLIM